MKFKIVHESRGRVRIQVMQKRMTLEQADLLEAYLNHSPAIRQAAVHERTCCAVIQYCGERSALLTFLSRFSYDTPEVAKLAPAHSGRALNRAYEEKLVGKVVFKVIRKCFLPPPLAAAYTVLKSIPTWSEAFGACCRENFGLIAGWFVHWNFYGSPGFLHGGLCDVPVEPGRTAGGMDP